ncbi:MAG: thermonuclease family protein [SAR324 cluster bacterium]|nr:thermonuclease family protein [SAR324 cluster bacterium]
MSNALKIQWRGFLRIGLAGLLPQARAGLLLAGLVFTIAPPASFGQTLTLHAPPAYVNDGDTFEADLSGNGRLEFPQERVRLLFVDTPELHDSYKGRNMRFGLPAKAFLESMLARPPVTLIFDARRRFDTYGRSLALLRADGKDVNLEIIRAGHSYFDTRFRFPSDYELYAQAEGDAFSARRGIWSSAALRKSYLKRLRKEGKTPRAKENALYVPGLHQTRSLQLNSLAGKFLRLQGHIVRRVYLRRGRRRLEFAGIAEDKPLTVYVSGRANRKNDVDAWPSRAAVIMDGFVNFYRGSPQLVLHHGIPLPVPVPGR